jgi:hypothetical protein
MATIELVYFEGCPNVAPARENLRAGLEAAGLPPEWREWNQLDPSTPAALRKHGSPTILVNRRDVTGGAEGSGLCCRTDGVPTPDAIRTAVLAGSATSRP